MLPNIKSTVKGVLRFWTSYAYNHYADIQDATRILKSVESYNGKTGSRNLKLCDEYAVEVLGHKHFAHWLYVYTAVSGRFKEGWMPENYYGSVVVPKLQGQYGRIADLRGLNAVMLKSDAFPDVLAYANGIFFDTTYRFVSPDAVQDKLFKNHERVVFKLDNSLQGRGIHFFTCESFSVEQITRLGNGLFQRVVQPHRLLAKFAKHSVATLRITTVYKDNGEVSVRACHLRMGSGEETHVQVRSQIRVPIHIESGAFRDVGYTAEWRETRIHPTSQETFAGNVIPAFKACVRTVVELHRKAPYTRCIGWDVTVDEEENVRLLEWNAEHNGIKFSEATQGPCFADLGWERLRNERAR
ncbi:MAG TPA: sugar-transfer associated ATP-grasp domain-containing protein [Nitrospira sp.]|nr:sugar-transfer associated ATP-grasp domain-containing protein [Nitrospira sp.]